MSAIQTTDLEAWPAEPEGGDYNGGFPDIREYPKRRIGEIRAFQNALHNPALLDQVRDSDEVFALTMQLAIDEYGVKQKDVADMLLTQSSTVGRWRAAASAPISYSRPAVISVLRVLIEKEIGVRIAEADS